MDKDYKQLNEHVPIEDTYIPDLNEWHNIPRDLMMYYNHLKIRYDYSMQYKLWLERKYNISYILFDHMIVSIESNKD